MKRIIILLCTMLAISNANAQGCLPNGIIFTSQEMIDSFQTNYPGCTKIEGDLFIKGWESDITNLNGLNVLTSTGSGLNIQDNDALTSLTGLNNIDSIGGMLEISDNYHLTSLTGLESLTAIGDALYVDNNISLTSLTGLDGLTSIGGVCSIVENDSLTSLTGLESLTSIGLFLDITYNSSLITLSGLEGLTTIGSSFFIQNNYELTSLTGLEGLIAIGNDFTILENINLVTLNGINNLTSIGDELWIAGNNTLSTCDVESICDYLTSPNGEISIYDNSVGCNSVDEVKEKCPNDVEEFKYKNESFITPNPSNGYITILSPIINGKTQLSIFNVSGEKVIERQLTNDETQIDISALPRGVYFVMVQNEKMVEVGKMVKE
jgi:hypothetical protein